MSDDGAALLSTRHPRRSLWRRIWFYLSPHRLNPAALETVEIDIQRRCEAKLTGRLFCMCGATATDATKCFEPLGGCPHHSWTKESKDA